VYLKRILKIETDKITKNRVAAQKLMVTLILNHIDIKLKKIDEFIATLL